MDEVLLVPYCKPSDFDAATGICHAIFYGPAPTLLPPMSLQEGMYIASLCVSAWFIGFLIKQARRPVGG